MTQTFMGNISQDIKELKSGTYAFSLAYNPIGKDKEPIFIRCVMFKDIVNFHRHILSYLNKGAGLVVTGTISEVNAYINKNQEPAASISLIVNSLQFLPRRKKDNDQLAQSQTQGQGFVPNQSQTQGFVPNQAQTQGFRPNQSQAQAQVFQQRNQVQTQEYQVPSDFYNEEDYKKSLNSNA